MDYGSVYRIKVLGEKEREESKLAGFIVLNILVVINHQIPSYIMPSCLMTYRSINLVKIHQRGQACNLSAGKTNIQITREFS